MFSLSALGSDPQYIPALSFLYNFLPCNIFSFLGFHGAISSNISNSSLSTPYSLDPLEFLCISSLFTLPNCVLAALLSLDLNSEFCFLYCVVQAFPCTGSFAASDCWILDLPVTNPAVSPLLERRVPTTPN